MMDLVNKGKAREVLDEIGTFVSAESAVGNHFEAKLMVLINSLLTRKVVINTNRRTYIMSAFYPKLPYLACKCCFVLYHDEVLCKEIQSRIYVCALPAPTPRASHVFVTKLVEEQNKGERSRVAGLSNVGTSAVSRHGSSIPTAFSVTLHPTGDLGIRDSSFSSPSISSVMLAVSSLAIKETVNHALPPAHISPNLVNNFRHVSPFENLSFGLDGLIHDRKGKRPKTAFEASFVSSSSFSLSASSMSPPHWPLLISLPHFNPPSDPTFNMGSLGVSSSSSSLATNVFWSATCSSFA